MLRDLLRRLKPSYAIYNFFRPKELKHNVKWYKHYKLRKKYYSSISSADFEHLEGEKNWLDVGNSSKELPKHKTFQSLELKYQNALLNWSENGYAILPGFFTSEVIDKINATVEELDKSGRANWRYGNKIMFAIHESDFLMDIGKNEHLMRIMDLLLGKKVKLFQSINFYKGSEQRTHSDTIHMTTFPLGNLIAAWVALEDIGAEQGPLHYYPGSHTVPYVLNKDFGNVGSTFLLGDKDYKDYEDKIEEVVQKSALKKELFYAKKGDVLIWHANLLHGGEPHTNKQKTRKSMVFHYYSVDSICYHEITERPSLVK